MAQKIYNNKILKCASKLKVDGFYFYEVKFCAQCHGSSLVDFHAVHEFYFYGSATNHKIKVYVKFSHHMMTQQSLSISHKTQSFDALKECGNFSFSFTKNR